MVFSSIEFMFLFLPVVLIGFLILRHLRAEQGVIFWLIAASLAFYAWWSVAYLVLLLGSVVLNYIVHRILIVRRSKALLILGIAGNLAALAYFKYWAFILGNISAVSGVSFDVPTIILPLAISFFTFQQISLLCDTWNGEAAPCDFPRYMLFIVFFPQLIAGPIVLQKDTIPQFRMGIFSSRLGMNLAVGFTLFAIGLFKKIVLADGIAPYANTVFEMAEAGRGVPFEAAWGGALAYTFQIYFDFSGYCDMALGLARLFGIRLPMNFNSPYKAASISDFWRRWHMTLSRFLRDYLYIALGGNRKGQVRRYANLLITMLLGGLWHGAAWTFVIWGGLHGTYLIINHAWNHLAKGSAIVGAVPASLRQTVARVLTLTAVVVAWVFFRAESVGGALEVLEGMVGVSEVLEPARWASAMTGTDQMWLHLIGLGMICLLAPNSIEIVSKYRPVIGEVAKVRRSAGGTVSGLWSRVMGILIWRPTAGWATAYGMMGLVAIIQLYRLGDLTEFIYFNF